jgi:hypothetical protein
MKHITQNSLRRWKPEYIGFIVRACSDLSS